MRGERARDRFVPSEDAGSPAGRRTRFKIRVQLNRLLVFTSGVVVGLVLRLLGFYTTPWLHILLIAAAADGSALLFYGLYRSGLHRRLPFSLDPVWLLMDMGLISWGIYLTGGAESFWFPWYLANIAAAAFVVGQRAAFLVFLADCAGYLSVLWLRGDVHGLDATAYQAIGLMVCLYTASFFFLRGVAELVVQRRRYKQLKNDESRKVEELTRVTEALERRTREAAEANLKLTEADRLKSQFLANMSHELRTPLNSIIGFSGILRTHLAEQLNERHARFIDYIHSSGEHLLRIINDILDLSKIEAGSLELNVDRFGLRSVVEGVWSVLQDTARKRHVELDLQVSDKLPPMEADPVRIKQVIYNLLSNAVKFSYEDSKVEIAARHLPQEESMLGVEAIEIQVQDHGIGIDPEDRELIFQEFYQVDGSTSREFEGTGLGLALVKRFVDLHGGVLTLESAVGQGSTFGVVIPITFQGSADLDAKPAVTGPPHQCILVVEDDLTAYERIRRDLGEAGYRAVRARTGEDAIDLAGRLLPLAITLDIVLPGIDGWEVLRQLKTDGVTRDIPVIIVSMLDNRELGLALGADDYFTKPVDTLRLTSRLSRLLPEEVPERPHVLLIDDDEVLHDLVAATLGDEHYELEHAFSGREGVEIASRRKPDLILLDLMMEGMDGFEVATVLKSRDETAGIPIVVLTAKDMNRDDRERLHGKIEALLKKGESGASSRLPSVIRDLVRRRARETARE